MIIVEGSQEFRDWLYSASDNDELKARTGKVIELLKSDAFLGEQIQRRLWPRYSPVYDGINNLYRVRITDRARITYTIIARGKDEMVVRILEFFPTHSEYDRRFGYK